MRKFLEILGKISCWFFALFFMILMFAGGVSAVFFGLGAFLAVPSEKVKRLKEKLKIGKKLNIGLLIILFFAGAALFPQVQNDSMIQEESHVAVEETTEEILEEKTLVEETEEVITEESSFSIRFLDVNQADATLVECDGHYMLIDGGNRSDSDKMYAILKESEIQHLDIVVGTHVDEDHIGGLAGALNYATADKVFCTTTTYDTDVFSDFAKYADQNGGGIMTPKVGEVYSLGSAEVTILGINAGNTTNDSSVVFKIKYGETTFLFTGDAEAAAEQEILNAGLDISATVLKVGHHGSADSTTQEFLDEIMPSYAVISVGSENMYLHPAKETLDKLKNADAKVYRTDLQGEIVLVSDGENVSITTEKNVEPEELMISGEEIKAQLEAEERAKLELEKKKVYTYQSINKKMYAAKAVNVREIPNTDGQKLGGLSYAEEVAVTGKCNETGWYRIIYHGIEAYVSDHYLTEEKPEQPIVVQRENPSENDDESTKTIAPAGTDYVLNKNTGKFHYPSCRSVKQMKEKNKIYFNGTRDEVIAKGYDSCGNCHP